MTHSETINAIVQIELLGQAFKEAVTWEPKRCVRCQWKEKAKLPRPSFWDCINCLDAHTTDMMMKDVKLGNLRVIHFGKRRKVRSKKTHWRRASMADRRLYMAAKNA